VVCAPLAIALPHVGVLLWSWLSFMNPHREVFGAAQNFPFIFWIAALTLGAWFLSRQRKAVFGDPTAILMLAFLAWTSVTTVVAFDREWSYPYWLLTAKTFVLAFAVIGLINSKTRIQAMIWIIAISLGYYAAKGAGFTLMTGGGAHVYGPENSMISDNNALGLALVMTLPLLNYLRLSSRMNVVAWLVSIVIFMTVVAVVGTYSRGAAVGLAIVAFALWLRSRSRITTTFAVVGAILLLPNIVPPKWYERINTIGQYSRDQSFEGRVAAWRVSWNIARERPLTGGGFFSTQIEHIFKEYSDRPTTQGATAAHSIYFQVLGDHGFVGLALYLLMLGSGWLNLSTVRRIARNREDLRWSFDLASMMQISLLGMCVAGALLSMAYYDVFLVLIALTANLRRLAVESEPAEVESVHPNWRRLLGLTA
jgi:probable O-glycosylation ligase (exosortase A-associated)